MRETGEQAAERIIPLARDTPGPVSTQLVTMNGCNYGAGNVREQIANAINGAFVSGFAAGQAMPDFPVDGCTDPWHIGALGRNVTERCLSCNSDVLGGGR